VKLKLAEDLSLPVDVVTQTIAVLAKRRAGKSYTMRRLAEQLATAGQQIVIVDPKGDQWGIRSAADGKSPGLPIVILGGERADVPLESGSGEVVAKLVVEERVSALLDLSLFRKHEVSTFMTGFLENLYRLKAREIYRTPLMLVIDEADAIAPQKPQKGEERMLGAAEDIVRRGGQRGIGCVLVTQRSAVLNKNVLTQAQVLIALRTIAPQDLAAMNAWIDVHGTEQQKRTLMASLPSLPVGDAWIWSPGWPTVDGIFKRVHVLPIETFDSGATPKPGEARKEPKTVADVDLDALKRQMSATIEKAKADDPRELKKQIAALKAELSKGVHNMQPKGQPATKVVEKPLTDADRELLAKFTKRFEDAVAEIYGVQSELLTEHLKVIERETQRLWHQFEGVHQTERQKFARTLDSQGFQKILDKIAALKPQPHTQATTAQRVVTHRQAPVMATHGRRVAPVAATNRPAPVVSRDGGPLPPGEVAVLTAALQYPGLDRKRLGILTGYKRSSRDAYIVRLASKGLVEAHGAELHPTDAGRAALNGNFEPLPTGEALVEYWRQRLPEGERKVLDVLLEHGEVRREQIDEITGYKRSSRDAYLVRLKARGLVEFSGPGTVSASAELFE
jgi:hypothetical protein